MHEAYGGGDARSFCRAWAYCSQAVFRSCRSIALQNVVSTCPGPGTSRGNGVGVGEDTEVGEAIGVGCGEKPPGAAVADAGCFPSDSMVEAALAPWKSTSPAL